MTVARHAAPGAAVRALLLEAIDYAGLFPPAQLDMQGAVAEYASYLASKDLWALGTFVVPATRLDELAAVAHALLDGRAQALGADRLWRVSAVLGPDVRSDMERVRAFEGSNARARRRWAAQVHAVELRASTPDAVAEAADVVGDEVTVFIEIPITGDVEPLIAAIGAAGAFAKVRTGGTSADAFPSPDPLARFLATCVREGVPFKATAGLHHPLRGEYPLTYAPDSLSGTMYGFLNVALAAAFLSAGESESFARTLLEERDPGAVQLDESGASWRGHRMSIAQLLESRARTIRSFGSCSFREPIDDLASLGML